MKLIGITGKKHSGKTTVAGMIDLYRRDVYIINFADELKREVSTATGVSVQEIDKNKDKFRSLLQWWGTEFRREMCRPDYWVTKWVIKVYEMAEKHPACTIVCADVRFKNEMQAIVNMGGEVWRVKRVTEYDKHKSETDLDSVVVETVLENYGTEQQLAEKVRKLL